MSGIRKPGCIEPVLYYFNFADAGHAHGFLMLAPYSGCPTPAGYELRGAETLAEVDRLEATLVAQERAEWEREYEHDEQRSEAGRAKVRDALYAKLTSNSTDEYEKEFIRNYLQLREDKRGKYRQRHLERTAFLWARHNDIGKGRGAGDEVFNVDKHEVKS